MPLFRRFERVDTLIYSIGILWTIWYRLLDHLPYDEKRQNVTNHIEWEQPNFETKMFNPKKTHIQLQLEHWLLEERQNKHDTISNNAYSILEWTLIIPHSTIHNLPDEKIKRKTTERPNRPTSEKNKKHSKICFTNYLWSILTCIIFFFVKYRVYIQMHIGQPPQKSFKSIIIHIAPNNIKMSIEMIYAFSAFIVDQHFGRFGKIRRCHYCWILICLHLIFPAHRD